MSPGRVGPGFLVAVDAFGVDAALGQGVELAVEVLLAGRDPRVSVVHGCHRPRSCLRTDGLWSIEMARCGDVWELLTDLGVPLGRKWNRRHSPIP